MNRPDERYAATGGPPGASPGLLLAHLQTNGATADNLPEAWREVLDLKGFTTGNFNTDLFAFLGGRGHTGALADRLTQWWTAGGSFI